MSLLRWCCLPVWDFSEFFAWKLISCNDTRQPLNVRRERTVTAMTCCCAVVMAHQFLINLKAHTPQQIVKPKDKLNFSSHWISLALSSSSSLYDNLYTKMSMMMKYSGHNFLCYFWLLPVFEGFTLLDIMTLWRT